MHANIFSACDELGNRWETCRAGKKSAATKHAILEQGTGNSARDFLFAVRI